MSRENVDRLRAVYALLNEEFDAVKEADFEPLVAFFDPEVVIAAVDVPDPGVYEGHAGVRRWASETFSVWESIHIEPEEFIEIGDWTVAHLRTRLRGAASGVEVEIPTTAIHRFRDGKIVQDRVYLDRAQALDEAARLSE
jgi:ketosteroid isomerase-like protein